MLGHWPDPIKATDIYLLLLRCVHVGFGSWKVQLKYIRETYSAEDPNHKMQIEWICYISSVSRMCVCACACVHMCCEKLERVLGNEEIKFGDGIKKCYLWPFNEVHMIGKRCGKCVCACVRVHVVSPDCFGSIINLTGQEQ